MTPNKLPPLPEPSISFGAQSGLSGIEGYSAEQMEHFAISFAASLGTAPEGSWLWCKLMDWLRSRRLPPAEYGDLFAIVKEAHDLNKQDTVEPVGDEAMALHWIDRYACGVDDEPQLDRIRDALYQDNAAAWEVAAYRRYSSEVKEWGYSGIADALTALEAIRQSQSLPAGAVAEIGELNGTKLIVGRNEEALASLPKGTKLYALQADAREKGEAFTALWRPIESAPKDESSIILWDEDHGAGVCLWDKELQKWIKWWHPYDGPQYAAKATHWMPLPHDPTTHPAQASEAACRHIASYVNGVLVCERCGYRFPGFATSSQETASE